MTIKELILYGTKKIKEANIENAKLQTKILLSDLLKKPKEYLIINQDEETEIEKDFKENIEKIVNGYPIQYITKKQEFMKLNFYVDENVLIPQPDTEILVEKVINICKEIKNVKILDMCTGSGAIAISLAKYLENSTVIASDVSEKALEVAEKNAKANEVKINFLKSDMFEELSNIKFDVIVSNPPYIETDVIKSLSNQVKCEPHIALDGGEDGLYFYKILVENAYKFLNKDGYLCLEIGYNQKQSVTNLLKSTNKYQEIFCIKDLANIDRVIIAKKKE